MSSFFSYNYIGGSMKLKYRHDETAFSIICFIFSVLCALDFSNYYDSLGYALAFLILSFVFLLSIFIKTWLLKILKKKVICKGEKKQGYIVDIWGSYGLKGLVDNDVFIITNFRGRTSFNLFLARFRTRLADGLVRNKAYKYICSELKNIDYKFNSVSKTERFPIDVYFYRNRYYFDLDSVELDMKNL